MKAPVSGRALMARINRQLEASGQQLRRTAPAARESLGEWHIIDIKGGGIARHGIAGLEPLGRELGALKSHEEQREEGEMVKARIDDADQADEHGWRAVRVNGEQVGLARARRDGQYDYCHDNCPADLLDDLSVVAPEREACWMAEHEYDARHAE